MHIITHLKDQSIPDYLALSAMSSYDKAAAAAADEAAAASAYDRCFLGNI